MKSAEGPAYARLPSGPSPSPGLFTPLMSLWPDRKLVFKTFPRVLVRFDPSTTPSTREEAR